MTTIQIPGLQPFSNRLDDKIQELSQFKEFVELGPLSFDSKLILAPMAGICNAPFRMLMKDLGAGGTVSEFVSSNGINHGNQRTRDLLRIHPTEKNIGIQIFGENAEAMASAVKVVEEFGPDFIDINMGCPVKKVVTKGGGSALLKNPEGLEYFLKTIKASMTLPLTIKIRMGWDADLINADEIIDIAAKSGVSMVAIHGRTRSQGYSGVANWDYIESLVENSPLPIIGNGDLHHPEGVHAKLMSSKTQALMIARGCLRNPFIFLESLRHGANDFFDALDYLEAIERLKFYTELFFNNERTILIQLKKLIVWFSAGFPNASHFRSRAFACKELEELMELTRAYYCSLEGRRKQINYQESFMTSGHG